MANYNSIAQVFGEVKSPVDVDFMGKVLMAKQNSFDLGLSQIDESLAAMKQQENLLIRDEDKARFAGKIQNILSTVNASGKLDLSSKNITRSIKAQVGEALDDYTVSQISNSQTIRNAYAEASEKQKKGDPTYSAVNFNDMIAQAGVDDYLKGYNSKGEKVDSIGSLNYQPYVNAPKVLDDAVSKWAKDHGYHTQINSENKGLYFVNTKSEVLTKDEILNYLDVIVDPNIKAQMEINTRASYGRLDDTEFNRLAKERYVYYNTNDSAKLAEQKAKLKTESGEKATEIEKNITALELKISDRQSKIDNNNFDRKEQYKFYKDDIFGGIAEAYDKNEVIDIDYNDTLLEIEKYKFDVAYKTEDLRLKKEANKIAKEGTDSTGTSVPVIPDEDEAPKADTEIVRDAFVASEANLKNILSKEDTEYKKLTTLQDRNNYVRALMASGGVVNLNSKAPLSNSIIVAINNHKNNYKAYGAHSNKIKSNLDVLAKDQYEDMRGATNLNLNHLGTTAPVTANSLKSKKPFNQLRADEQEMIRYERVVGQLQFDDSLSAEERAQLKSYAGQIKTRNSNNKWFQNNANSLGDLDEIGGSTKNVLIKGVYGTFIKGVKNIADMVADTGEYYYDKAFNSQAEADKNRRLNTEKAKQDWNDVYKNYNTLKKAINDSSVIGMFNQDMNITEVDTGEDTKSGGHLSAIYRRGLSNTIEAGSKVLKEYIPTIPEKQSFSFSTEDKGQKAMAIQLSQVIQKHTDGVPGKGENNYNLEYFANSNAYTISYLDSDGKKQTTPLIDKKLIPKNILDTYQMSLTDWSTNLKNPKATVPTMSYTRPIDRKEGENMIENLAKTNEGVFTEQEVYMMLDSPMFQTPSVMFENITKAHPEIKDDVNKQRALNELMNTTIKTQSRRYNETTFQVRSIFLDSTGKEVGVSNWDSIGDYDESSNLKLQLEKIAKDFNIQVNKIVQ